MIQRVEKNGKRLYEGVVNGQQLSGTSVTTIIGAFEDKQWLENWWFSLGAKECNSTDREEILAIGKQLASVISNEAASFGTAQHSQAEFMLSGVKGYETPDKTTLPESLGLFLHNNVIPYEHEQFPGGIGCEVPIIYQKNNNVVGGTTDIVCKLKLQDLYAKDTKQPLTELFQTDIINCIGDYKFPKKPKYDKNNLRYFVQLAAYRAGLTYTYDIYEVQYGLLIVAPRSVNTLYLWLFAPEVLNYYHKVFDEMLFLYGEDCVELFDWNYFADKALKEDIKLGMRIEYKPKT